MKEGEFCDLGFLLGQMVKILTALLYRVTAGTGDTVQRSKQRYLGLGSGHNTARGVTAISPAKTCIACNLLVGVTEALKTPSLVRSVDLRSMTCQMFTSGPAGITVQAVVLPTVPSSK